MNNLVSVEELRQLNAKLELGIAERTAELRAANHCLAAEVGKRQQADALLTLTLAGIQDGVIVADAQGAITFVNDAAARLIGRDASDAIGAPVSSVLKIIHATSRARVEMTDVPTASPRGTSEDDLLLIGPGNHEVPCELRGAALKSDPAGVRAMVYTVRDSTAQKRAADVQQRMAALVESAEDAIIIKSLDGVVRSWNPAAERLLEYRADEIIGQPITRLLPDDRQNEESLILARMRRGESIAHFETVRRRKGGSLVDVSLTISPIRDRDGVIVGASKIMRDITERKNSIEQLRHLNAELEARVLARTAEILERDVMIQEIHHRVKNNLQVISSLINMQVRSVEEHSTRVALQQCQSRVQTMAQIHDMLYQSKNYARVSFRRYAKELATRVLSASDASSGGITITYQLADLFLAVDQAIPCGLILNELLCNALKHAFPSGVGTIGIEFCRSGDDQVLLSVSDNGIGVSAQFDPAHSKSLGVALVTALVKQLDGTLEIRRQPGTTFRITFPWVARA
jgi:PAS domain S-box-containing protein